MWSLGLGEPYAVSARHGVGGAATSSTPSSGSAANGPARH